MEHRDQQDVGSANADRRRQEQQQGQRSPTDTGQASYGNSSEGSGEQGAGQSSAADAGKDRSDTLDQEERGSDGSTSAQRSGGQTDGGQGMGNESFAGSSLGGQAGSPDPAAAMFTSEPSADSSEQHIDPTSGQGADEGLAREGQGVVEDETRASDPLDER